jgi:GNAT superfamily N-acetyltransferase
MGQAFVDDRNNPTAFKLQLGPFCYFAGSFESEGAIEMIRQQEPYSLLMTCPDGAIDIAREHFGERLIRFPRYSFSSQQLSVDHVDTLLKNSPFRSRISRIGGTVMERLPDPPDHVFDISSFDSAEDFLASGIGYALMENNKLTAVAYSSLVSNIGLEVSIYVEPEYRGQGVATALGCALIKECLERNVDPHWDAANAESCTLAKKLG